MALNYENLMIILTVLQIFFLLMGNMSSLEKGDGFHVNSLNGIIYCNAT